MSRGGLSDARLRAPCALRVRCRDFYADVCFIIAERYDTRRVTEITIVACRDTASVTDADGVVYYAEAL